ncbi:multiple epidermal growth factor-like domains protein 10 [Folsomia candida]|uniref:EB domain-containing protein n=1 Tax=Folsomia candida TaxID=158441 RepID=A0A226DNS0_FOLCA|nr:multiple epidermal growth factor-like domains protein 10 [Folsomia candida]OXA47185.1 hypothetical protein Fcan01_18004 [Folsomia candida]
MRNSALFGPLIFAIFLIASSTGQSGGHGDPCSENDQCLTSIGLECREQICQCKIDAIYNEEVSRCQTLAGGDCSDWADCIEEAYCGDNKCHCYGNYFPTPDGFCQKSYGYPCQTSAECYPNDQLICAAGRCECQNSLNQVWMERNYTCNIKVGFPCQPQSSVRCGEDMACVPHTPSITGYRCGCDKSNYLPTVDREHCRPGYAQPCSEGEFGCDERRGLKCFQGVCQCAHFPSQVWDEEQLLCAGVEGTMCSFYNTAREEPIHRCLANLGCNEIDGPNGNDAFYGICQR